MPRQPDGSFTLYPGYNPVASNTEIKADWANNTLSDIAAALSNPGAGVVIPTGGTVADTLANLFGYTLNVVSLAADKTGSVDAVSAFMLVTDLAGSLSLQKEQAVLIQFCSRYLTQAH